MGTKTKRMNIKRGTIIELTAPIEDPYSPKPVGARLQVSGVDDANQIHGHWLPPETGCLAVIIGVDKFKII